jgi:hypothetical protein
LVGTGRVEDYLALGNDQEARRAVLVWKLLEHGREPAGPIALLVGVAQMRNVDLDPDDLFEFGRGEPSCLVLFLPHRAVGAVPAADIDHLDVARRLRDARRRRQGQTRKKEGAAIHVE